MTKQYKTHLVIPDSHAMPGVSNERYDLLAKYIVSIQPDVVIDLGDFADMASLCTHDAGTIHAEGRRLQDDIAVAKDARVRLTAPIRKEQARRKYKKWEPRLIALGGNHEQRVDRYVAENPELAGMLTQDVSGAGDLGWEWYDYTKPVIVDGILYCHIIQGGPMGRPVGGANPGRSVLQRTHMSAIWGHTHTRTFYEETSPSGKRLIALNAGCFFDQHMGYAGEGNKAWWQGVVLLTEVEDGSFNPHFISMQYLKTIYKV